METTSLNRSTSAEKNTSMQSKVGGDVTGQMVPRVIKQTKKTKSKSFRVHSKSHVQQWGKGIHK